MRGCELACRASSLVSGGALVGTHAPASSWKPAGQEAHCMPEVHALHEAGHASHVPVVALAKVALGQKAVQRPEGARYGLLEVATHELQLVTFEAGEVAGDRHVAQSPWHGMQ